MNLKRVFIFAAVLCCVSTFAFADPPLKVGTLQMTVDGLGNAAGTLNMDNASGYFDGISTSTSSSGPWTPVDNNYASAAKFIAQAYSGGNWTGLGITSSVALAHKADCNGSSLYAVAPMTVADYKAEAAGNPSHDYTHFMGQDLSAAPNASILAKFTYMGDANLDGIINYLDYSAIDNSVITLKQGNPLTVTWGAGDFNLDGAISYLDYSLIDSTVIYAKSHTMAVLSGGGITPVPEPSTLVMVFFAMAGFVSLRKIWK